MLTEPERADLKARLAALRLQNPVVARALVILEQSPMEAEDLYLSLAVILAEYAESIQRVLREQAATHLPRSLVIPLTCEACGHVSTQVNLPSFPTGTP